MGQLLNFQPLNSRSDEIIRTILQTAELASCGKALPALHLVCEELVVNVVNYAYVGMDPACAYLQVAIDRSDEALTLTFRDGGVAFNPLERPLPDVSLPLEERDIGGLGIFLTVKMVDEISYERRGGENVLTLKKYIEP